MAIDRGTEEDYELVHGEKEDLQERGEKITELTKGLHWYFWEDS